MRIPEIAAAAVLAVGGVRSVWVWVRRSFEGTDVVDHLLYASFVVGRSGLWFAVAGLFLIYATVPTAGRAALDDLDAYRWYLLVPLGLACLQLVAGFTLGRRSPEREPAGRASRRP
jgi:ABC-type sulfate transport system permease component